jgi:hypothetical protein
MRLSFFPLRGFASALFLFRAPEISAVLPAAFPILPLSDDPASPTQLREPAVPARKINRLPRNLIVILCVGPVSGESQGNRHKARTESSRNAPDELYYPS